MNRTDPEADSKYHRKVMKLYDKLIAMNRASAEPLRREADTTGCFNSQLGSTLRTISPPTFRLKPRAISVGTQTWPTTHFKPLPSVVRAPKNCTCKEAPNTEVKESEKTNSVKTKCKRLKRIVKHSSRTGSGKIIRKRPKPVVKDSEDTKSINNNRYQAFSMVTSKSGRFDHATTNRSESPVNCVDAKPSSPFQ